MGLGVTIFLRKTKVDNVDLVATFTNPHEKVVRLDITVNKIARVDVFDTRDLLNVVSRHVDACVVTDLPTGQREGALSSN